MTTLDLTLLPLILSIQVCSFNGFTPLHYACDRGRCSTVEAITDYILGRYPHPSSPLGSPLDQLNKSSHNGVQPIHLASDVDTKALLGRLIAEESNTGASTRENSTRRGAGRRR